MPASVETPANLPLVRQLWKQSATALLGAASIPTRVLTGGRDVHIDQKADGGPLQQSSRGNPHVAFAFPPDANHVFKRERRTPAQLAATPGNRCNADCTALDHESLGLMLDWLRRTLST